jgi:hypothetical protein
MGEKVCDDLEMNGLTELRRDGDGVGSVGSVMCLRHTPSCYFPFGQW